MEFNKVITGRRSVRDYTLEALEEATIQLLIEDATQAPSAINRQPWNFTVIRDPLILDSISNEAKKEILATASENQYSEKILALLHDPNFHLFYHAPVLVLISVTATAPWMIEDCTLAAENLMLAAFSRGLGSCWIGFAQNFLNTAEGKKILGIPDSWVSVAPIILGHPKTWPPSTPRRPPTIHWVG